jgi:hypothetical protein
MGWLKNPYEWARGKSGYVWIESREMVENLILKGWALEYVEKETIKLLPHPEPANFLHTPKNERTYYKLFVDDLFKFYSAVGWLHGYYH